MKKSKIILKNKIFLLIFEINSDRIVLFPGVAQFGMSA